MTTKAALIATAAIIIGGIVLGLVVISMFIDPAAPGAKDRSAMLGQGVGFACVAALFVVWIMWADRFRKERERRKK